MLDTVWHLRYCDDVLQHHPILTWLAGPYTIGWTYTLGGRVWTTSLPDMGLVSRCMSMQTEQVSPMLTNGMRDVHLLEVCICISGSHVDDLLVIELSRLLAHTTCRRPVSITTTLMTHANLQL